MISDFLNSIKFDQNWLTVIWYRTTKNQTCLCKCKTNPNTTATFKRTPKVRFKKCWHIYKWWHIHDCLQAIRNILNKSLKYNNFSFIFRCSLTRHKFALSPGWFRSVLLSRLGWSSLVYRWGCSNRSQLALTWLYCQLAKDHNYLQFWLRSSHDLNEGTGVASREASTLSAGKIQELSYQHLAARSVETEQNKKSIGMLSWFLGMCPPTFMLIFSLHMNHTHKNPKHSSHSSTAFWGQHSAMIYSFQMSYEHNSNTATWQHSWKREAYTIRMWGTSLVKWEQLHFWSKN